MKTLKKIKLNGLNDAELRDREMYLESQNNQK